MGKCEIIIFWSEEDSAFVAEVPELPGCMADGSTHQEALSNAEQIVQEWIKTAKDVSSLNPKAGWHMPEDDIAQQAGLKGCKDFRTWCRFAHHRSNTQAST